MFDELIAAKAYIMVTVPGTKPEVVQGSWSRTYLRLTSPEGCEARLHLRGDNRWYPNEHGAGCADLNTAIRVALKDADVNNPYGKSL